MDKIYYDHENRTFLVTGIHDFDSSTDQFTEITLEKHQELLNALNAGCIIFDDLTYSEPRPSHYHTWDGAAWVMTEEAQAQKAADDRDAQLAQAKQAQSEANLQITVLHDRIELEDYSTEEELGTIQADLLNWKKYRIELTKFINGQIEGMPAPL